MTLMFMMKQTSEKLLIFFNPCKFQESQMFGVGFDFLRKAER